MPIASLVLAALLSAAEAGSVEGARLAALRGDAPAARREAEAALAAAPADARALFLAACLALDAGDLDAALARARRLAAVRPAPPEAAVLQALVARRRATPRERMRDAVAAAWKAAGRPDLSRSALLGAATGAAPLLPPLDRAARARLAPGEAFVFTGRGGDDAAHDPRLPLALAAHAAENPLFVNLELLPALAPGTDADLGPRHEAVEAARRVGAAVVASDGGNGALAAAAIAGASDQPLGAEDLDALEAAAERPRFAWPRRALLAAARESARRASLPEAELRAVAVAHSAAGSELLVTLCRRAEATGDPGSRPRAEAVLVAFATRLEASPSLYDVSWPGLLRGCAANVSGDPERIASAQAWAARRYAAAQALQARAKALGEPWPLPSIVKEWDPDDELPFLERLAR